MMTIRPAVPADVPLILSYIQRKATFDHAIGAFNGELGVSATKLHQTLFGPQPFAWVLFAELEVSEQQRLEGQAAEEQIQAIGFALYGFRYSSFAGQPSIWLDDLYVDDGCRSQGAGALLMQALEQVAIAQNCSHLAWTADVRNLAGLRFYQRLGAKIIRKEENRCYLKWTPNVLFSPTQET